MRKYNFELHKRRKTPCDIIQQNINVTDGLICSHCLQMFTNRQAKYRHTKQQICQNVRKTTANVSEYFPFETPNVDHIDAKMIKDLYLSNNRSIKRLLNEVVRKIYGENDCNNSFRFPMGVKSNVVEVFSQGKLDILPVKEVVQIVLQKTSDLLARNLRLQYENGSIIGITCLIHANILTKLSCVRNDKNELNQYSPYVKAAILECSNVFPKF
jgi:hypothetical protein